MTESNDKSFLYFEDITEKYDDPTGWITVARFDSCDERDSRCLFSVLASNNQSTRTHLFNKYDWEAHYDFGHPYFSGGDKIKFSLGSRISISDNIVESFMILRTFHNLFPDVFEPAQNFILYHNLIYDCKTKSYIEPVSTDPVIRYVNPEYVQIRIEHLKDYLAARQMLLVRFHDHRRQVTKPVTEIIEKNHGSLKVNGNSQLYAIDVYADGKKTCSRLLGKNIIIPYAEPLHHDYLLLTGKCDKYVNFTWKRGDDGNPVEASCTPKQASSDFLRPIYFKKGVLQKYYSNPRTYCISDGLLKHFDIWSISYGQNECDMVTVWLGDLGQLPYEEQLHWKQYNKAPEGSVGRAFYKRQIMAEFAESDDPVHTIIRLREQINKKFQETFGFLLFRQLSEDDRYVLSTLHSLTTNEQKEFDEQILYLAKGFVESLNKKSLKSETRWMPESDADNITLNYFEHFLCERTNLKSADILTIVEIFRIIQKLRSLSVAHTKSASYKTYLTKMGFDEFELKERFLNIAHSFSARLRDLLSIAANDER